MAGRARGRLGEQERAGEQRLGALGARCRTCVPPWPPGGAERSLDDLVEVVGVEACGRRCFASARALPPTASARSGAGGRRPANALRTASVAAATCRAVGGSPSRRARVSRSDPRSAERIQAAPSNGVPTAISVEPPPTSTTATTSGSVAVGPGDGAIEGEPTFLVGGESAHRRAVASASAVDQRRARCALTARCGDDHRRAVGAELRGPAGERCRTRRRPRRSSSRPSVPDPLDLGAEPEVGALLGDRTTGPVRPRRRRRAGAPCSSRRR